jgi:hypothetical protein
MAAKDGGGPPAFDQALADDGREVDAVALGEDGRQNAFN